MNEKNNKRKGNRKDQRDYRNNNRSRERDDFEEADRGSKSKSSRQGRAGGNRNGVPSSNHPEWYSRFPALVNSAASLPFSNPLGQTINASDIVSNTYWANADSDAKAIEGQAIPGIMRLATINWPGISDAGYSAINVAANALYTNIRHANSGSKNYDANDLMLYVLAIDSMYSLWAHAVRAYSVLCTYSWSNRYLARYLFNALGWNFENFVGNIAQFRSAINDLAFRLGSLCAPADMSYITRHVYLYGTVFMDSPSLKAQMYAYAPSHVFKYEEVADQRGGVLKPVSIGMINSIDDFINKYRQLSDAILTSESLMIMGGDILKALGSDKLQKVTVIPESVPANIVYDERQAMEIQNVTIMPIMTNQMQIVSDVDSGSILAQLYVKDGVSMVHPNRYFLNVRADNVTPEDVMKATRMMAFSDGGLLVYTCGTELVHEAWVYEMIKEEDNPTPIIVAEQIHNFTNSEPSWKEIMALERFDWHPYIYGVADGELYIFGDMDNYTLIDAKTLQKIHEAALFSEFYSSGMGNFITG